MRVLSFIGRCVLSTLLIPVAALIGIWLVTSVIHGDLDVWVEDDEV